MRGEIHAILQAAAASEITRYVTQRTREEALGQCPNRIAGMQGVGRSSRLGGPEGWIYRMPRSLFGV